MIMMDGLIHNKQKLTFGRVSVDTRTALIRIENVTSISTETSVSDSCSFDAVVSTENPEKFGKPKKKLLIITTKYPGNVNIGHY